MTAVTLARLLKVVMSALPEAEEWAAEVAKLVGTDEDRRVAMLTAVEARAMRCASPRDEDTPAELRALIAEAAVLLVALEVA